MDIVRQFTDAHLAYWRDFALTEEHDPCQDRGVGWPCDVADAFGYGEEEA